MIKLNDKKIKELILSGKHLKQSEFDTIRNRSDKKGRSIRIRIETSI